ncbi:hypothetical protein BMF94_1931 [Rhodotorula taiwanensis]|uniref:Uncharacterized protein n=1 Tax=Rhodotorula taiwanensis TaxID=741276 RepID=A0A2S5BDV3_9BASI|nr:hypothetical protein BMF94_1931 [Rhodotorula taiwanensis]
MVEGNVRPPIHQANQRTSEVAAERTPQAVNALLRAKSGELMAKNLPRAVMLGHWTQRTWDVIGEAVRTDCCLPVAYATDLQDAITVIKSLLPPPDILLCSSYYDMEEVQDALLAYDSDINVLIAPKGYINTHGTVQMTAWLKEKIESQHFFPRVQTLSPSDGFLGAARRASQVSASSSSEPSFPGA